MTAEENRLAHFKRLVEQLSPLGKGDKPVLREGYRAVADATGLKYDYVYQVYQGKSGKKGLGPDAIRKISEAFGEGRPSNWMDLPLDDEAPPETDFEPIRPPTLQEAVDALAVILNGMEPLGRELASTVLASLAKSPEQVGKLLPTLEQLVANHSLPPEPPAGNKKSTPAKDKVSKPARRIGKAHLVLKIGGGQRQQFTLPLTRSAFRQDAAPANEKAWYERVKAAPKARGSETK